MSRRAPTAWSPCRSSATASGRPRPSRRVRRTVLAPWPGSPGPRRSRGRGLRHRRPARPARARAAHRSTELRVSGRRYPARRVDADQGRRRSGVPVGTVQADTAVTGVALLAGLGAGDLPRRAERHRAVRPARPAVEPDPATGAAMRTPTPRYGSWLVGRDPPGSRLSSTPGDGADRCACRLGINTCFAVKRWPRVEDWAPIVRDRLGLKARAALARPGA